MGYSQTPVQEFQDSLLKKAGVRLFVKREDLNNPSLSGNKWWKLKYNIMQANREGKTTLLTFGGAFSNHIYATAAAAHEYGLKSIGIIRGDEVLPLNATLKFAVDHDMKLHFISRADYKHKDSPSFIAALHQKFGDFYLIPEGGSNLEGIEGCAEFAREHLTDIDCEYIVLAVGTGATMAGIISAFKDQKEIIGVPVLKGSGFLYDRVAQQVMEVSGAEFTNWRLLTDYHYGGYAKTTNGLTDFIARVKARHGLPLDHVYTGKAFAAVMNEIESGTFRRGSSILFVHTGGLQGSL